ncbi:hypothetical protein DMP23_20410 [Amycolatopsis sp. A1MSW2902]
MPWLVAALAVGLGPVVGGMVGDLFAGPALGRTPKLVQVGSALGFSSQTTSRSTSPADTR